MRKDPDWPLVVLAAIFLLYVTALFALRPEQPLLMGIGCENSTGPLYAMEEDHFPLCKEIIPYD